jgi:hypothetical protein
MVAMPLAQKAKTGFDCCSLQQHDSDCSDSCPVCKWRMGEIKTERDTGRNRQVKSVFRLFCTPPVVLTLGLLCGCGTGDSTAPYLPNREDHFVMQDQEGRITQVDVLPLANVACQTGPALDFHFTKTDAAAYWDVGLADAQVHWVVSQTPAGWQAVESMISWDGPGLSPSQGIGSNFTIDYATASGTPYIVVPNAIADSSGASTWWVANNPTTGCLIQATGVANWPGPIWTSQVTLATVSTPAYSGPALRNEECEGAASLDAKDCPNAPHEVWYFAPGVGLVEIDALWEGVTLKRQ